MNKQTSREFAGIAALIAITIISLAFGTFNAGRVNYLEKKADQTGKEVNELKSDLKDEVSSKLESEIELKNKSIELLEKNDTIQMMYSQNEGLKWQLENEGFEDK